MDSKLEPGIADILLRSRKTILDILGDRGYDTTLYRNIAPSQILALAEGASSRALEIVVNKQAKIQFFCPPKTKFAAIQSLTPL